MPSLLSLLGAHTDQLSYAYRKRQSSCEGKHAYPNAKTAIRVAKRSRAPLSSYRCEFCHGFHIGRTND